LVRVHPAHTLEQILCIGLLDIGRFRPAAVTLLWALWTDWRRARRSLHPFRHDWNLRKERKKARKGKNRLGKSVPIRALRLPVAEEHENTKNMSRLVRILCIVGIATAASGVAWAEDTQTTQELKNLEQVVQEQSKRIDSLTQQVAKLRLYLESKNEIAPAAAPEEPAKPATAEPAPEAPKAEAVPKAEETAGGAKHVVAKGETLTSIAKHYNISLAELHKANKSVNDRKLQIGQTLTIPTPKPPESAPEKKE
jgi:LysM repeat protein